MTSRILTLSILLTLVSLPAVLPAQTPAIQKPAAEAPAVQAPDAAALPDAPSTTAHDEPPAVPTGPTVLFDTSMGRLTCKLFSKEAPNTVDNFVGLATGTKTWTDPVTQKKVSGQPFYDGTTFHRVIPGFMIQGGDRMGTGAGDAGYYFPDEFSTALRFDVPGRLAMANAGPDTNGSQFFITEVPVPELDGKHTIFGQCDPHTVLMVGSIARVERNADDKPLTPVVINKVTIVPDGQPIPPAPAIQAPGAGSSAAPPAAEGLQPRPGQRPPPSQ
jgi:peptidyl-prolyl cis-trans isomerase A (cyclophilin A)